VRCEKLETWIGMRMIRVEAGLAPDDSIILGDVKRITVKK
jgi:hypothetical protein